MVEATLGRSPSTEKETEKDSQSVKSLLFVRFFFLKKRTKIEVSVWMLWDGNGTGRPYAGRASPPRRGHHCI